MALKLPELIMHPFIGTKLINAKPMTRLAYNEFRGWQLPENENGADEGYLVEYVNGGQANTEAYSGYVSWSPKEVFEREYRRVDGLTFGLAVEALKKGFKVARAGWNGKGMFLFLVPGSTFAVSRPPLLGIYPEGKEINYKPNIDMQAADGSVFAWNPNQLDVLAEDWTILQE
jgi:hypothetical protein